MCLFNSSNNFCLKVKLWWLFSWYIFFHAFTFNLNISLNLKCVSFGQDFVFLIKSDNLCLLIELFNSFRFNVIINVIGFIFAILLSFSMSHVFFVLLFLLYCLFLYSVDILCCANQVLWVSEQLFSSIEIWGNRGLEFSPAAFLNPLHGAGSRDGESVCMVSASFHQLPNLPRIPLFSSGEDGSYHSAGELSRIALL